MTTFDNLALWLALDSLTNKIPRNVVRDSGAIETIWDDCLLDQLEEAAISSGESGGGSTNGPESKPPVSMEVLALNVEMRNAIAETDVRPVGGIGVTLHGVVVWIIEARPELIDWWTGRLNGWAARIRDVSGIDRARERALPINCPRCDGRWITSGVDGEIVRRPIMSALFDTGVMLSMTCAACGTWQRGASLDALVNHMMSMNVSNVIA